MNGSSNSNCEQDYKVENNSACLSELSSSALRGAVKVFELQREVAFESTFSTNNAMGK